MRTGTPPGRPGSWSLEPGESATVWDELEVRGTDGTRLATDVYLPRGGDTCPAVLIRTPYGRRGALEDVPALAGMLNDRGYGVVAQDVRGRYGSSGVREPFVHEVADGTATLEWIARQPWSDGRVVPMGDSYTGFTALAAAASHSRHVVGAVARVTTCHVAEEWLYRQGVFRLQPNAQWAAFAWGGDEIIDVEPDWRTRPLSRMEIGDAALRHLEHWVRHPPGSAWWADHRLSAAAPAVASIRVPVLHATGWWDLFVRGQLREWSLLHELGASRQHLRIGATDHMFNPFTMVETGDGPAGSLDERYAAVRSFLESVTRQAPRAPEPVEFEVTHAGWRTSATWPPADARPVKLYLGDARAAPHGPEGGALATRAESIPATVSLHHDPHDLVPSLETFVWGTLANNYPDERPIQVRDDVLTFTSDAMAASVDIASAVHVVLRLHTAAPEAHIAATLCDVYPMGPSFRLVEGTCLVRGAESPQEVVIDLGPLAHRVRSGHRLRLALAASSYPRYLPGAAGSAPWSAAPGQPHELLVTLGASSHLAMAILGGGP